MHTFLHKKNINFLSFTFDQYGWLEIINWFSTFCVNFVCNDILLMNKTLLQLKDLKSENMKTSKSIVVKGGCVQHHFSKKQAQWPTVLLACWIHYRISCNICKYKKNLLKIKKTSFKILWIFPKSLYLIASNVRS